MEDAAEFLTGLFQAAIDAAAPASCLPQYLPSPPVGRTLLIACGKAAASMAKVTEEHWPKEAPLSGIALTRYGHGCACDQIELVEASHPVPDDRGYEISKKIIGEVAALTENDLLLFLVSGGGSALFAVPATGIALEEKKAINRALLKSGAPIGEMNIVRKHLSAVKGGRLAALASPAKVVTLAISDVPYDDPSTIASGPTVPDTSTSADAIAILDRYAISVSDLVHSHLLSENSETPKPGDPVFHRSTFNMIARPADMLAAVLEDPRLAELRVKSLGADIEGEAREVGQDHGKLAFDLAGRYDLILSGGETTVTVSESQKTGRGGRNCEYLLALAVELNGAPGIYAIAADTDGIDGSETNAGAIITPDTLKRGAQAGLNGRLSGAPRQLLLF